MLSGDMSASQLSCMSTNHVCYGVMCRILTRTHVHVSNTFQTVLVFRSHEAQVAETGGLESRVSVLNFHTGSSEVACGVVAMSWTTTSLQAHANEGYLWSALIARKKNAQRRGGWRYGKGDRRPTTGCPQPKWGVWWSYREANVMMMISSPFFLLNQNRRDPFISHASQKSTSVRGSKHCW